MSVKICASRGWAWGVEVDLWMLCLHHVPCSGIIWFSSVLATGARRRAPSPVEDWLWSSSFQVPGGTR